MWGKLMGRRRVAAGLLAAMIVAGCEGGLGPIVGGQGVNTDRPVTVALLVPGGSGDQGRDVLAASLENAARLAVADLQGAQIDLRVYQTAGDANRAASVAQQAVDDGAQVILGPLFADAARAVGQTVAPSGVNVLSFSNNPSAASRNVFLLGPMFENTATRLMDFASAQGKGRIMLVAEQNQAGEVATAAVRRAASRSAADLVAVQSYPFSQQGVVQALPGITAQARSGNAQTILFTAGSEGALPLLAELLPQNGLSPQTFQYAGLTRWDIPASTMQLSSLQGGWFALPDPSLTRQFDARYMGSYGQAPHPVGSLGYDAVAAVGALLRQGGSDALTAERITQGSGFAGVTGVFRFRADGSNERGLAIAEIRDGTSVVISPAPRSFGGGGF
ncbi:hypothetical protein ROE7235_01862 [Roseibaca ekhonensis]|uniref:Leucine-binding protein domain-containing protein n=2 Tax=Roseinatronobacter ekhonensis TaxID=254356 RepID=A0A3B0MR63_9RHOB|nr:penicillin-binding protein activator [Roseibaca ekhonensis]SUZ32109.1 hypothetical protein ROE7235_01862 [Roseibaca ekhonensis]